MDNTRKQQVAADAAITALGLLSVLWFLELLDLFIFHGSLNLLGIIPRTSEGLFGILAWPFLHGDFQHLMGNSLPLFVTAWIVALRGVKTFIKISFFISITSGLSVWVFSPDGIILGASGLAYGLFGFILCKAFMEKSQFSVLVGVGVFFMFFSMLTGLVTGFFAIGISWEAHAFGFLAGIVAAGWIFQEPLDF